MIEEQGAQVEPWMAALKAALDAGYYQRDDPGAEQLAIPKRRKQGEAIADASAPTSDMIHVECSTNSEVWTLLTRVACLYNWSIDEAVSIIFHHGLFDYTDDGRRRAGRHGLWSNWDTNPAQREQLRLLREHENRQQR